MVSAKVPFWVLVRAANREFLERTLAVLREGVEHHSDRLTGMELVIARQEIAEIEKELEIRQKLRCGEDLSNFPQTFSRSQN